MQPKGRGAAAGLLPGDLVVGIGGTSTEHMTHQGVKNEMLRAGNELDLTIQRFTLNINRCVIIFTAFAK